MTESGVFKLQDVRARTRSRARVRGGARARGEGPGVRAVRAHRPGEDAVPEREQRRGRQAGVQAVGPAEGAGHGKDRAEPPPRLSRRGPRGSREGLRRSHDGLRS